MSPTRAHSTGRPTCTKYLAWLPVIVLMIVKKSSNLALQLSCVVRLGHRNSVVKEPVLHISW